MKIGVPKEIHPGERRVAVTPATAEKLIKLGVQVLVEAGAGEASSYADAAYEEVGAKIAKDAAALYAEADMVLKVRPFVRLADASLPPSALAPGEDDPEAHEASRLKEGSVLVGFVWPTQNKSLVERLAARKATVLAMDAVPRITRAQKLDALSAMASVAGYRAVVEAASRLERFFPGQVTAAGRVRPAHVLVVGAGVAGLAAIAAARSLGAVVRAFDTRPAVREQVESLGATFVPFEFEESGEGQGGYAKEVSEAYLAAEQALLAGHAKEVDVIVTTALVPGKPAPKLVTSGAVVSMQSGSVIVDLAAEQGGNCALTDPGRVVTRFGVTIVGLTDLPSRMARQSSDLYAATVYALVEELFRKKGTLFIDHDDEVHRGMLVLEEGRLMWPPPARPRPPAAAPLPEKPRRPAPPPSDAPRAKTAWLFLAMALLALVGLYAPPDFLQHLTVFLLACVVGWQVVWNVTPALHTPLMSVTNAISGIILIGGMLVLPRGSWASLGLGALAIILASINVAGGFLVTQRMLRMFRK